MRHRTRETHYKLLAWVTYVCLTIVTATMALWLVTLL